MANLTFAKEQDSHTLSKKDKHKILIVDDDQAVHDITNIALESMKFSDFELEVLTAYSSSEAKIILNEHDDIALALIDVVMETPEAGLDLVNYIRKELQNDFIRLIIRTGQANDFPPMHVIQHYDINDFKEKTELTLERLYTTIRTSIKQYCQLLELQHKYEETYRQMTTDSLTLLPNRIKLIEDFSKQSHQTLILIDIIGFSHINDTNGYDVGDYVLKELAAFLTSMYSESYKVYHLNNDVFALVTTKEHLENLQHNVEKIKKDISKFSIVTENLNIYIETTIGVAYQTEDDVLKKAELALKEARNLGRNQIKFYSNDLKVIQQINDTNHWSPIIKYALEHDGIMAYAQPIFNLIDQSIDKYELLVRIKYKEVVYSPHKFIQAARNSGQLYNIFKFMFNQACKQASKTGLHYSINISDCEFHHDGLVEFIENTIKMHAVDPKLLSLEILESHAITQSDEIRDIVLQIHTLGLEFVIDDFGVQCSNFAQTEFLPITTLKIDGSFIKNIHESKNSKIIVKTIQTFAKEKGLKLIAEFVCNQEVYNEIKELGIEYAQGHYLAEAALLEI
ncbi:MAG: EAL domain-containing protein [Sulfurovum sp.]|uniref:two-component system response regulator n=1 Tax=Sulfurovum sp. TaxID=1969726 RepID=UPI0028680D0A|nr:EAL domain-containing protein [Sulfurovum sp.]MCO4845438.1 EAL domain-containing protein [Sulfurovum sp.]